MMKRLQRPAPGSRGRPAARAGRRLPRSAIQVSLVIQGLAIASLFPAAPGRAQSYALGPSGVVWAGGAAGSSSLGVYGAGGFATAEGSLGSGFGVVGGLTTLLLGATTITCNESPEPIAAGSPAQILAEVHSPLAPGSCVLQFRPGGAAAYRCATMAQSDTTYSGTIPWNAVGPRGLEYFFTTAVGPVTMMEPSSGNPHDVRVQLTDFAPGTELHTQKKSYRMVSFAAAVDPSAVDAVFTDDLGSQSAPSWRLARYDPRSATYKEYTATTPTDPIAPGNAFWLITKDAKSIDFSGLSRLPADGPPPITLRPGWNQIGSPWAFDVDLESVVVARGDVEVPFAEAAGYTPPWVGPLHEYVATSSDYEQSDRLRPWTGYFLANQLNSENLVLKIGPAEASARPAGKGQPDLAAPAEPDWLGALVASNGERGTSRVELGFADRAAAGLDRFDGLAPPPPPDDRLRLVAHNEQLPAGLRAMRRDVRPMPERVEMVWELLLEAPPGTETRLEWTGGPVPPGKVIRLVDQEAGRFLDLGTQATYSLVTVPSPTANRLLIAVGNEEFVEGLARREAAPKLHFGLSPAVPNPVRQDAVICFTLSQQTRASLRIYDVEGRLVHELVAAVLPAGQHVARWDGRQSSGRAAASGIYYVKLAAEGRAETRPLVLLR